MKHRTIEELLHLLSQQPQDFLKTSKRGIEREGLRVSVAQKCIADTFHPQHFGSKLTHPHITTDYAESLLELITSAHPSIAQNLEELTYWHRITLQGLPQDEFLWGYSMPCALPKDSQIAIAQYGSSVEAQMKTVYREGLALRYGKHMQCIAGLHYNFSLSPNLWQWLATVRQQETGQLAYNNATSTGYMHLIRNVIRYASSLLYLFGASPAFHQSFNARLEGMEQQGDMYFLPYATSLRMSDIGYQSAEQKRWLPRWSDLSSYVEDLFHIVSEPSEVFSRFGTHQNGQWVQLNTNRLQLENEFYAPIRPKAIPQADRPLMALWKRGVEYVELRCLDIDPFEPIGISATSSHFIELFLTWCALKPQEPFAKETCDEIRLLFAAASQRGRDPNLLVSVKGQSILFHEWLQSVLETMQPVAQFLEQNLAEPIYTQALQAQLEKVRNPQTTPAAKVLSEVRRTGSLSDWVYEKSLAHAESLASSDLSVDQRNFAQQLQQESLAKEQQIANAEQSSFEAFLRAYDAQLDPLRTQFGAGKKHG